MGLRLLFRLGGASRHRTGWGLLCQRLKTLLLLLRLHGLSLQLLLRLLFQGLHHGWGLAHAAAHLLELLHGFLRGKAVLLVVHDLEGEHLLQVRGQPGTGFLLLLEALLQRLRIAAI